MAKRYEYQLLIQEHHLDTFGHVNNATYMELYEQARWDFITKNGFGLEVIQKQKLGPVILEANIKYKKEIKNRQIIRIESESQGMKNSLVSHLKQWMINEKGQVVSEADFYVGFFDMQERKLLKPSADWFQAIGDDQ